MLGIVDTRRLIRRHARLAFAGMAMLALTGVLASAHAAGLSGPAGHHGHGSPDGETIEVVISCVGVGACALALGAATGHARIVQRAAWSVRMREPTGMRLAPIPAAVLSRGGPPGPGLLPVLRL